VTRRAGRHRRWISAIATSFVLVACSGCNDGSTATATTSTTLKATLTAAIATINASCRRFVRGIADQPEPVGADDYQRLATSRLENIEAADRDLANAAFPPSFESLRRDVAAHLDEATAIFQGITDVTDLDALAQSRRRGDDVLRQVAILFYRAGALDCVAAPPDRSPVPSPPEAGELLTRAPVATISVGPPGADANRIVATTDGVWVGLKNGQGLRRIDPATNLVAADIPLDGAPGSWLVALDGLVWAATPAEVVGVSMTTDRVDVRYPRGALGYDASFVDIAPGTVSSCTTGVLNQVDLRTGAPLRSVEVAPGCQGVASLGGRWWVTADGGVPVRIDPQSGAELARATDAVGTMVPGDGMLFVYDESTIARLDPDTGEVLGKVVRPGCQPLQPAVGGGALWLACEAEQRVIRVDAATMAVVELRAGNGANAAAYADGTLWVANSDAATVMRFDVSDLE